MKKGGKRTIKYFGIGLVFAVFVFALFLYRNLKAMDNIKIGKTLYLKLEDDNMNADYIRELLNDSSTNIDSKFILLSKSELGKLINYMEENHLKIVPGEYTIPQTSSFEELIKLFEFTEG